MVKHRYKVKGVVFTGDKSGLEFEGTCVAYDIISAIRLFRDDGFSVHTVPCREQVNAKTEIGIENIHYIEEKNNK